jgi:hypothetical protein
MMKNGLKVTIDIDYEDDLSPSDIKEIEARIEKMRKFYFNTCSNRVTEFWYGVKSLTTKNQGWGK